MPYYEQNGLRHFGPPEGRFWTPAWDYRNNEECTVKAIFDWRTGAWHEFDGLVSVSHARAHLSAPSQRSEAERSPAPSGSEGGAA